ncbi:unnamed protein product [Protopolystoma xenopodis]|uniref:Uncharacterized protein n=1 Tax=Protopolystoma xenopodis TaxID=117903 RepID=A0A3S5CSR9_9PLAT|nr:unnamed protein product [Protopolystoma xenopodis]
MPTGGKGIAPVTLPVNQVLQLERVYVYFASVVEAAVVRLLSREWAKLLALSSSSGLGDEARRGVLCQRVVGLVGNS